MSTENTPIRPATPVNPTAQTRPTPIAAPTTARPPSTVLPDFTKVKSAPAVVNPTIKAGINSVWNNAPTPTAAPEAPAPVTPPPAAPEAPAAVVSEAPAPAAPEAPDRFADIIEPEGISEAGKKGWKALKTKAETEISAAQKRLADAEAQLATFKKSTPADTADVDRLRAEHQKTLDRLAVLDLQSHPDFTRQYSEPKSKALAEANEVLGYNGKGAIDPALLLSQSQKDFNAAVAEATNGMNAMDAMAVQSALRTAYKITNDEKTALTKAGELKSGIEARDAQARTSAFQKVYGNLGFENLISPKEAPATATVEERAQVAEYNAAVSQTKSMAERNAFGRLTPDEAATVATKAAYLDTMVKHVVPMLERGYSTVVAERNALAKELQAIKGLKSPGSFTAPAAADTGEKKDAKFFLRQAFGKK